MVMVYPKEEINGIIPRNYVCDHPKDIYPSIRDNPLSNNDIVPYLPCCYPKNHEDKPGSIYRHYYYEEELKVKEDKSQQDIIVTYKFAPKDQYGKLPEDIEKILNIFKKSDKFTFVRKGVSDSPSSFLECVVEGMYEETKFLKKNDTERREYIINTRKKMSSYSYAATAKQEMYDYDIPRNY